ncbi:MAG: hypothetical protein IT544_03660 [Rhodobacteraceae bacterium]|nr:hypothetical protein [Paracoccaceae bacterium]
MDYAKSKAIKADKNRPPHAEHNAKGTTKNPFGQQRPKAELIARMKAAVEAKKANKEN